MTKHAQQAAPKKRPFALAISAMFSSTILTVSAAPGDPQGPAFTVRAESPSSQIETSIARDDSGKFVVVWRDFLSRSIRGRRFAADGSPLDGGFIISAATANIFPSMPDVAMDAAGDFAVTWLVDGNSSSEGAPHRVKARRYSADGASAGSEFFVEAANSKFNQGPPRVAMDADGDFVIGFSRSDAVTEIVGPIFTFRSQVVTRRYNRLGVVQGPLIVAGTRDLQFEIPIVGFTGIAGGTGLLPPVDVAMDDDGDYVVAWGGASSAYATLVVSYGLGVGLGAGTDSLFARRYNALGQPRGLPQLVDSQVTVLVNTSRSGPAVAMDADGDYLVAWRGTTLTGQKVEAQRFSSLGLRRGLKIEVATEPFTNTSVACAAGATGSFVVTWNNVGTGGAFSFPVAALRVDADGRKLAPAFTVSGNDTVGFGNSTVASDAAGNFVVAWPLFDFGNNNSVIRARRYEGP